MISRLTKIQLLVFALVTLIGGTIVGGKYAQIDRLVVDRTFDVTAQLRDSGGIFAGAEVTYRGIGVGRVEKLEFTEAGVDATLAIENSAPEIPADTLAVVANKSAIGEQYVDLRPRVKRGPYLENGAVIAVENTRIPLSTTDLLVNTSALVRSIDTGSLNTVVDELGQGFEGTNADLEDIVDGTSTFVRDAADHLEVTRRLIRGSGTVLQTQIDKQGELRSFAEDLALFSGTLADSDADLETVADVAAPAAKRLDGFVADNATNLTEALENLEIAGKPLLEKRLGLQTIFLLYPYLLQGAFTVVAPSSEEGEYDAHFGLVVTGTPEPCTYSHSGEASGYLPRRDPAEVRDREFDTTLDCRLPDNTLARQSSKTELGRTAPASARTEGDWSWMLLDAAR